VRWFPTEQSGGFAGIEGFQSAWINPDEVIELGSSASANGSKGEILAASKCRPLLPQ
jgi:hypothetical protein